MQGKRKGETMASDEKKILIVEDEKVIRDAVSAYLERENYVVKGVGDGQSAVEEFEKHAFDLVILDLMLPKLSGERVCRAGFKIARIGMGKKQPRHRRNAESGHIGCRNRRLGGRTQDRNSESVWQRQTQHSATSVRTASCPSRQQHRHEQCELQCGAATED